MNIIAVLSMGALGALFALGLAIAHKTLKPGADPRVEQLKDMLPGANCGACGYASCEAMAKAMVTDKVNPAGCTVASDDAVEKMAEFLGLEAESTHQQIARLLCRGGEKETIRRGEYRGIETCAAAHQVGGSFKACIYGCLGFGDCVEACNFEALHMNDNGLPVVVEENCVACGACVEACPRDLFELHNVNHQLFVWCKSQDDTKKARQACEVACIGCSLCAKLCDGVEMEGNLAVVDHSKTDECDAGVEKCPTGAIAYLEDKS
ncbi:MAG: RnfABCDGE type electron transport complex subunit B [bacterium]